MAVAGIDEQAEGQGAETAAAKQPAAAVQPVSLVQLFSGGDTWDDIAICVAIIACVFNGAAFPLFTVFFGEVCTACLKVVLAMAVPKPQDLKPFRARYPGSERSHHFVEIMSSNMQEISVSLSNRAI